MLQRALTRPRQLKRSAKNLEERGLLRLVSGIVQTGTWLAPQIEHGEEHV